jgi:hypothetical protein
MGCIAIEFHLLGEQASPTGLDGQIDAALLLVGREFAKLVGGFGAGEVG